MCNGLVTRQTTCVDFPAADEHFANTLADAGGSALVSADKWTLLKWHVSLS